MSQNFNQYLEFTSVPLSFSLCLTLLFIAIAIAITIVIAIIGIMFILGPLTGPIKDTTHNPITSRPVPGRRCPSCAAKGQVVWVIPGKKCPNCGTAVN